MLEAGGNAVDAAVATAYALAVTHPSAGNIGGGGFMLVHRVGKPTVAIDFRETAPAALDQKRFDAMIEHDAIGPDAAGIPGTVAGLELAHDRYGKLSREKVLEPAIELAAKGHRIGHREGLTIRWSWPALRHDRVLRSVFGDGKEPKKSGTRLLRPDLAKTLRRIAEHGRDGFYKGETAKRLIAGLGKEPLWRPADLKAYQAVEREPLSFSYRGLVVETMPPPSAGGPALAMILSQLGALRAWTHPRGGALDLHLFLEASRRAQAERRFSVLDPARLPVGELSRRIAHWEDGPGLLKAHPIDPDRATPSAEIHPLFGAAMRELEHTTHLSVVDRDGNAVSLTTTLSAGFGAKIMPAGTGVVLNNSVASFGTAGDNLPKGGARTVSSMAPTLLFRQGRLVAVLGSPGGDTIPSTVAQVLRNLVDAGMTLDRAVDAPRVHHGFVPDEMRFERRRPPPKAVLDELVRRGHHLSDKRIPMGDANDIVIATGVAYGYADPREGGLALGAKE